jgi:hypothetical protein
MHYFQMEFLAHERQEELLREASLVRLANAFRSANRDDGLLHQLLVCHLAGLLRASQSTRLAELASKRMGKLLHIRLGVADCWHRVSVREVRPGARSAHCVARSRDRPRRRCSTENRRGGSL